MITILIVVHTSKIIEQIYLAQIVWECKNKNQWNFIL